MKMIFDMASVLQTALRKFDKEYYTVMDDEGKEHKIVPAYVAYESSVGYMLWALGERNLHPADAILVFEGRDSKKRRVQKMPEYKGSRGKSPKEYYEEYRNLKDLVIDAFYRVGATSVIQDLAEGDDTVAYLRDVIEEPIEIVTNDGDLTALAGTNAKGYEVTVRSGVEINKFPENVFEPQHVTLYKALVGDTSDSVKGCPGFGKSAWEKLLMTYGGDGLNEIAQAIEANDSDTIYKFGEAYKDKVLLKLVDNWREVRRSWEVVKLYPNWVNTRYYPLRIKAGIVLENHPDERFWSYHQTKTLVTADNYDKCLAELQRSVRMYPDEVAGFDIETSQPVESDDWFEAQGASDGVDPIASKLAGFSITFGKGGNRTFYVSVNHYQSKNVTMKQARLMIEAIFPVRKPIHNTSFELAVLANDWAKDEDGLWRDLWKDKGEQGLMPNVDDTLFMASYVNENAPQRGLKYLSKTVLNYAQTEFNDMRTFKAENGVGPYPGGKLLTKVLKEPAVIDGVQQYDSKGKPKTRTVKVAVPVLDEHGQPKMVRRRRKLIDGVFQVVHEPKTTLEAVTYQEVQYKMDELPATDVFDYGCDDTICTVAYWRYAKLHMQLDQHFHVYREVEIKAAYLHVKSYLDGFNLDVPALMREKAKDQQILVDSERVLHDYLTKHGWTGTAQPKYTPEITPAQVKETYAIVFGLEESDDDDEEEEVEENEDADPVMSMRIRKMDKILELIRAQPREGADLFAWNLEQLLDGNEDQFNNYIGQYFDGKPKFKYSNKHMSKLLYEIMGATVKVRNKVTPAMRRAGIREGNPKADALAIDYAILEFKDAGKLEELEVVNALKLITMVNTRMGLFYKPYPEFLHWHTGKIHSSHRQCHANTRRASSAKPNMQQLSAHEKIEGYEPRIRSAILPHVSPRGVKTVVVSMDFNAQELRLIADDSQDPNMLACYVGDKLKDMHAITGSMIAYKKTEVLKARVQAAKAEYSTLDDAIYYEYVKLSKEVDEVLRKVYGDYRKLGKKVNFTALYGAMAEKVAATLMVSEEDAQAFLDARAEAFRVAEEWKATVIVKQAKEQGFVRSRMGAKRHLAELLDSDDRGVSSKAERQAANFRIQGSAAEMTKMAEGRIWSERLLERFDATIIGPIHDEVVASVAVDHLVPFLKAMHACMVAPYADMKVEIKSSIDFGPNMQDSVEIGMEPTDEAIAEGLKKLEETGLLVL